MEHHLSKILESQPCDIPVDEDRLHRMVLPAMNEWCEITTPYHGYVEREGQLFACNNYRVRVRTRGSGLPLLLLSSDLGSIEGLSTLQDMLSSHCMVVSVDLLGDGASELPSNYGHYVEEDEFKEQEHTLHGKLGVSHPPWDPINDAYYIHHLMLKLFTRPPVVIACGWSTSTALKLASMPSSHVSGLILLHPHLYISSGMMVGRWPHSDPQHPESRVSSSLTTYDSRTNPGGMNYSSIRVPSMIYSGGCEGYRLLYLLHNSNCLLRWCSPIFTLPVDEPTSTSNDILCWLIHTFGHSSLEDAFQGHFIARRGDEVTVRDNLRCLFFEVEPQDCVPRIDRRIQYQVQSSPSIRDISKSSTNETQVGTHSPTNLNEENRIIDVRDSTTPLQVIDVYCRGNRDLRWSNSSNV